MSQRFAFDEWRKSREAAWFTQKEQELVAKLQERQTRQTQRVTIGEAVGIEDEEILHALQELGYTRETVELLYQIPLVQVAWANGKVTAREREWVLKLAGLRGAAPERPAYQQLTEWLENRPSDDFFQTSLRIIGYLLDTLPEKERQSARLNMVNFCTQIAVVSGGILGFGNKISEAERAVIDDIAAELERNHRETAQQVVAASHTPDRV
jgi:hypothetical protein